MMKNGRSDPESGVWKEHIGKSRSKKAGWLVDEPRNMGI